jgi:hypothetical protein
MAGKWEKVDQREYWPCACVKRDEHGMLSKVRLNFRTVTECPVCGCEPPPEKLSEWARMNKVPTQ